MLRLKNEKIIEFDSSFEFCFVEDSSDKSLHPASDYYLKASDLSINLLISLKWIVWGYNFFKSLSKELEKLDSDYSLDYLLSDGIQDKRLFILPEAVHLLIIDNNLIKSDEDLYSLINNLYSFPLFNENTKIHLKLKINLREFIIISHFLFPTFMRFTKYLS